MALNLLPRIIYYEETGRVLITCVDIYPLYLWYKVFYLTPGKDDIKRHGSYCKYRNSEEAVSD